MEEIWRDIDGYEGLYQISNLGRVKSLDRKDSRGCYLEEKVLKQANNNMNYKIVSLYKNNNGSGKQVSRLVAKAFPEICGEWFEGCQVHHKDHNPQNNCASNLLIISQKEHSEIHKNEENNKCATRTIFKYDKNWKLVEIFNNTKLAAASVCGKVESLNKVMREKTYFYFGYYFVPSE